MALSDIKALAFDVFGTVVDYRGTIMREGQQLNLAKGLSVDWAQFADASRALSSLDGSCHAWRTALDQSRCLTPPVSERVAHRVQAQRPLYPGGARSPQPRVAPAPTLARRHPRPHTFAETFCPGHPLQWEYGLIGEYGEVQCAALGLHSLGRTGSGLQARSTPLPDGSQAARTPEPRGHDGRRPPGGSSHGPGARDAGSLCPPSARVWPPQPARSHP